MGLLKFAQLSLDVLKQRGSKYKYRHELTEEWIGYQYIWYNMYVSIVFIYVYVYVYSFIYTHIFCRGMESGIIFVYVSFDALKILVFCGVLTSAVFR